MNCQMFEHTVNLLAREKMMDAGERKAALAHAAACEQCAIRLADEQALSTDLRGLVSHMGAFGASPRVEERLMASFAAQGLAPVRSSVNRRWVYAASAIAAALLLAIGFGLLRMRVAAPTNPPVMTASSSNSSSSSNTAAVVAPAGTGVEVRPLVPSPTRVKRNRHLLPSGNTVANESNKEVATDFIPVMYGATGFEPGSQVVRVELPSSAMASFGLPVNMNRADQRVKADVVLGVDGLAHAIRFVR